MRVNDEDFSLRDGAAGQPSDSPKKESRYSRASRRSQSLFNSKGVKYAGKAIGLTTSLLVLVVALILAISVFRILTDHGSLTFSSFMDCLVGAPSVGFGWIKELTTFSFKGVPKWLRSLLRFFTDSFAAALWISTAMVNAISYIFYFLRWLFVV